MLGQSMRAMTRMTAVPAFGSALLIFVSLQGCSLAIQGLRYEVLPGARALEAEACRDFRPGADALERFFARARPVTVHEAEVAACVARGTFHGQPFEVNALGCGWLQTVDGDVQRMCCPECFEVP